MELIKSMPRIDNILWLSKLSRPYPATSGDILELAKKWGFSGSTIDFLELFRADEVFKSSNNFLTRCEELEQSIHAERDMPLGNMLSLAKG